MSTTGLLTSPPVIVGNVTGGLLDWEKAQTVYYAVEPASGQLAPHFAAMPGYNPVANTLSLSLTSYNKSGGPIEVDVIFTAYDDLLRGPSGNTPPTICGESRTKKTITIRIHPVNRAPEFNWVGQTSVLAYPDVPYRLGTMTPTVGPDYEQGGRQQLLMPTVTVLNNMEAEFTQQPVMTRQGELLFRIAVNPTRVVPKAVSVRLFLKDDGGTLNGGTDNATMDATLFIAAFFDLVITPPSIKFLTGNPTLTVTGGLPSGVQKMHYLWKHSGGSADLPQFLNLKSGGGGEIVKLVGPTLAKSVPAADLPEGSHSVFTLLFPDGPVDFTKVGPSVQLCPNVNTARQTVYGVPCYLSDLVIVTPSNKTTSEIVTNAKNLAANVKVPASEAFAAASHAATQIGTKSDADSAPAQRDDVASAIKQAAQRIATDPTASVDDISNGVGAVRELAEGSAAPGEDSVSLTDEAVRDSVDALTKLSEANHNLWNKCCSLQVLPAGCATHTGCAASCCGQLTSTGEAQRVTSNVMSALDALASATSALEDPKPWDSEAAQKDGLSAESLTRRRAAANLANNLLQSLQLAGENMCAVQLAKAVQANNTSPTTPYADGEAFVQIASRYVLHAQAMNRNAVVRAADSFTLTHSAGSVECGVTRKVTTSESRHHGCRVVIAFFKGILFSGDGEPSRTPMIPTVAVKLSVLRDSGSSGNTFPSAAALPYVFSAPMTVDKAQRYQSLRWSNAQTSWVPAEGGAAVKVGNNVQFRGSSVGLFGSVVSRDAQTLQGTGFNRGLVVATSAYQAANDSMCFWCIALPVYWGLFVLFAGIAAGLGAMDQAKYRKGLGVEAVDHHTSPATSTMYAHQWFGPAMFFPLTIAYYTRVVRTIVLFTFFIIALGLPAVMFDNVSFDYDYEHSVDAGKAAYTGCLVGVIGWLFSAMINMMSLAPLTPVRVSKRGGQHPDEYFDDDEDEHGALHRKLKLIPQTKPASKTLVPVTICFLFFGIGMSLMLAFGTSKYTTATQGEQYMLTFFFACLLHFLLEIFRGIVTSRVGWLEGKKYYSGGQPEDEVDEDAQADEMKNREPDVSPASIASFRPQEDSPPNNTAGNTYFNPYAQYDPSFTPQSVAPAIPGRGRHYGDPDVTSFPTARPSPLAVGPIGNPAVPVIPHQSGNVSTKPPNISSVYRAHTQAILNSAGSPALLRDGYISEAASSPLTVGAVAAPTYTRSAGRGSFLPSVKYQDGGEDSGGGTPTGGDGPVRSNLFSQYTSQR